MSRYISQDELSPVVDALLHLFEHSLTSQSSMREIGLKAQELLSEHGITDRPRWSLCLMLAKQAKTLWHERCLITQNLTK